jgi:hypothetical protein
VPFAGNGFGFRGFAPDDPYFERSTADVRDGSGGVLAAQPPGEGGPTLEGMEGSNSSGSTDAARVFLASLFTPCNR